MSRTDMYRGLNPSGANEREISEVTNNILNGKTNNTGSFSTAVSTTTTTLSDERIGFNSVILFMPLDSNSAAELGSIYFDTFSQGSCTVHHGSHSVSRNYRYIIVG
jgi:hypothetical protein